MTPLGSTIRAQPRAARRVLPRASFRPLALLRLLPLLVVTACVSRTLTVTSQPPGARVMIDGAYVGTTPYAQPFDSYGTRSVDLELEGYLSRHELLAMPLPWWQFFPLDVVTDLLLPLGLHDDFAFDFALLPRDPDAGTWDDARAAYAREQALREQMLHAVDEAAAAKAGTR